MTSTHEPESFDAWFAKITAPTYPDDPGEISPATRRFLRDLFEAQGPVSRQIAHEAFGDHLVAFGSRLGRHDVAGIGRLGIPAAG